MTEERDTLLRFREAVRLIDAQRRILNDARAPSEITETIGAILRHLYSLSDATVLKMVGGQRHKDTLKARKQKQATEASSMTLDEVEAVTANLKSTRVQLEAIAIGRFQVPSGSLRTLGSMDQLREKISVLVQNERAHETISSVAKDARY